MKSSKLSTQPYKGARDFYPNDMQIRNYIFNTWRKVCKSYGYEEYDGPFLESFDLYAAKTGEEIVNEQLYSFEDRGGRKVAIRPEMTPTLARMVSQKYKTLLQPIRWFSIPNLWRYEKPQKGRLREHYQLNVDIFGINDISADFETISVLVDIMRAFGAKENMFEIRVGNRRLIEDVYKLFSISKDKTQRINKAIDKKSKISEKEFKELLEKDAKLNSREIDSICQFLKDPQEIINKLESASEGAREVKTLLDMACVSNIDKFIKYDPSIIRGIDYYTGNVFELYNLDPENTRAMSGGGRYDNLVELFIDEKISGTGFGMGDVTLQNFLENWKLLPTPAGDCEYLITVWPENSTNKYFQISLEIANTLRQKGVNVQLWLDKNTKLDKQLKYADRKNIKFVVIVGESELNNKGITIKNLANQTQETKSLEKFLSEVK